MQKTHWISLGVIIFIVAAFYGGMQYANAKNPTPNGSFSGMNAAQRGQFRTGNSQNVRIAGAGDMTRGEILSLDDHLITIKTESNGSKIVMFSDKTEVTETMIVPKENLSEGKTVMITGETNDDGTISASAIFIREPMPTPPKEEPTPETKQ